MASSPEEGAALNVTAWSYVDRLCVGVLTCPDLLPDPHRVADGPHAALGELRACSDVSKERDGLLPLPRSR